MRIDFDKLSKEEQNRRVAELDEMVHEGRCCICGSRWTMKRIGDKFKCSLCGFEIPKQMYFEWAIETGLHNKTYLDD